MNEKLILKRLRDCLSLSPRELKWLRQRHVESETFACYSASLQNEVKYNYPIKDSCTWCKFR